MAGKRVGEVQVGSEKGAPRRALCYTFKKRLYSAVFIAQGTGARGERGREKESHARRGGGAAAGSIGERKWEQRGYLFAGGGRGSGKGGGSEDGQGQKKKTKKKKQYTRDEI